MSRVSRPFFIASMLFASMCFVSTAHAQPAAKNADEQAVRAAAANYVKTVNAGDASAVGKLWTEDADYVNESGQTYKGRTAIEKLYRDQQATMKGKKFAFEIRELRVIAPGVALEDGVGKNVGGDESEQPGSRYAAVWVKKGNDWLLSSVRDLGEAAGASEGASPLKQLGWLVGDWQSTAGEIQVEMNCASVLDGKFLRQRYDVKGKGPEFTVVTMIGWNPLRGQVQSWFFDSRGGFGEGLWTRDGNSWKIASNGAIADGRIGHATNIWKYTDENTAVWQTKDRELEGVPMPETEVKFVRKSDAKK
jgi:uncharacterized protein (TIGR02246 family)